MEVGLSRSEEEEATASDFFRRDEGGMDIRSLWSEEVDDEATIDFLRRDEVIREESLSVSETGSDFLFLRMDATVNIENRSDCNVNTWLGRLYQSSRVYYINA